LPIEVTIQTGAVTFRVRVQPRASSDEVGGDWGGALKVRLVAPPVDDRANDALCKILAARLNVPAAAVKILGGEHSRLKRVQVRGVSAEKIQALANIELLHGRK
jgi:uncharacterized protein